MLYHQRIQIEIVNHPKIGGEMPRNMEMKLDLKKANKKGIELIEPRKNGALTSNTEDPWTRNAV